MKKFHYNKFLVVAIVIGLIASLVIAVQRHNVEVRNNTVDMVVDYESLWNLSEREGLDFSDVLTSARLSGITSLAVYETTLEKMSRCGRLTVLAGYELITNYQSGALADFNWRLLVETGQIDPNRIYIIGNDPQLYSEVKADLIRRVGQARVRAIPFNVQRLSSMSSLIEESNDDFTTTQSAGNFPGEILEVKAQYGPFMTQNLGIPTYQLKIARDHGFNIVARPSNYLKCSIADVHATFNRLEGYPVTTIVFEGQEVLGSAEHLRATALEMKRLNYNLGLIEHTTQLQFYPQAGLLQLAQLLGYDRCARLYAIPKDEQPKLDLSTAVNRWATTDHERNIRLNLLRIYDKPKDGMTLFETNMKYFTETSELLKSKGYVLGPATTFDSYYPSPLLRVFVVIGAMAAVVLYLSLISKRLNSNERFQLVLFVLLAAVMALPVLLGAGGKVRLVTSLVAANVFPALAIIWQLDSIRFMRLKQYLRFRRLKGTNRTQAVLEQTSIVQVVILAIIALIITGAVSMAGAAYLSGALSDVEYFLEIQIFRGIKLTFVLPLILVAIAFMQRFNLVGDSQPPTLFKPPVQPSRQDQIRYNSAPTLSKSLKTADPLTAPNSVSFLTQVKQILDTPVKVKALLGLFVAAAAVVVLIARSGHTAGIPVSGTEIQLRSFLESLFYARPRSKEILIGHPAFMLAIMAFFKRWPISVFFLLVIAATIGQSSMVETFAHMRTPFFMSFMRGIDGLFVGAILGIVPMLLIHFCDKFYTLSNSPKTK